MLAENFLSWCRQKVRSKEFVINESSGVIQKVSYKGKSVISVFSPKIFAEYASGAGLPNPATKSSYTKIQNAIHNNKLNIPSFKGQIHTLKIKKSLNNPLKGHGKIRVYLFEISTFVSDDTEFYEIIDKLSHNANLIIA